MSGQGRHKRRKKIASDETSLKDAADLTLFDESASALAGPAGLHVPVLLREVLSFVDPKPGQRILDATLGMGGHSEAMLALARERGAEGIRLLGLDRDAHALALAKERLAPFGDKVYTMYSPFSASAAALRELGWESVDFALADVGVSSLQIDSAERGFSFSADGPLDMRMDRNAGRNAASLVNSASVQELCDIIKEFGEDPMAGRIARAIDDARSRKRIESTLELARIVERAYPAKWRAKSRNHPATRTFQALRVAVNDELDELRTFLRDVTPLLRPGGRIAVISFHSLEDRIVKHFFRDEATGCRCPRHVPYCVCGRKASLSILTRKPIAPGDAELQANPRASSAKLRVAEKVRNGDQQRFE